MNKEDMNGFLSLDASVGDEYAKFTYLIETPIDPIEASVHLCQEQSTAQWHRVGVKEDFRIQHGAKVLSCKVLGKKSTPLLAKFLDGKVYTTALVTIAHPIINFGPKIPNLITAAAGEGAFHCPSMNAIKLVNVELPRSFVRQFTGPIFGLKGIRKKLNVYNRPLFTGVVKPNIGLQPGDFAKLAYEAWMGGLDVCKDDEMLADVAYSPIKKRLEYVIHEMHKAEDKTGQPKMYIANITDEVDRLLELHDTVVGMGGNAIMVNTMTLGWSAVRMLAKHTKVPIFSHFDFVAAFSRMPNFGVNSDLITRLTRLSGCDAIIMPGLGKRMMTTEEEVQANVNACLYDMHGLNTSLPIPGGSDWAGSLPLMYKTFNTIDFSMVPGRGVFGHPSGPKAGAESLHQAWEAIEKGVTLELYGKKHPALQEALTFFGAKK
ncbi:MAG: RuBisCO large subunit C-terminal-like domain-containing protein [Candidatus Diapherotrites archaeon]